ncbi:MAG: MFS transporter [Planctomycetaceae bacterium]
MGQPTSPAPSRMAQYATLTAALLGWMFDGFEMGLFPVIGKPALKDLLTDQTQLDRWFAVIMAVFLVGAASGGVLFGWLGDKIGRVRAMSLSILTYALLTGMCGFATQAWQIAVLRFIASLGMGGEWSLGVALVNEIWPGKSRAFIAGLIGAASNVGFLLVALLSMGLSNVVERVETLLLAVGLSQQLTDTLLQNSAWRFLMISGAFPALLIFFIRLFVPESSKWEEEHASGKTSNWSNADLAGVLVGCLAAIWIIGAWSPRAADQHPAISIGITVVGLIVAMGGFLFPVWKYLERTVSSGALPAGSAKFVLGRMLLGAGLAGIALLGTWGSIQWAPRWASELLPDTETVKHFAAQKTQIATALGAIVATILAAMAAGKFGRRPTYAVLCLGAFASAVYFYQFHTEFNTQFLIAGFIAGGVTASFYGFFPLYFPELFPTSVRATGQGFSFNFGRIIAAIGGLQTPTLMAMFGGSFPKAGSLLATIYLAGVFVIWLGPETKGRELPE